MNYVEGELVTHPRKPEWGIGMIIASNSPDEMRIHFHRVGVKTLRLPVDLLPTGVQEMITVFRRGFPKGFADKNYIQQEREYKDAARELMAKELGKEEFHELLIAKQYDLICRRALTVLYKTNLVFPNEKMALKDGLISTETKISFSEKLNSLLYGEGEMQDRFMSFANDLFKMRTAKWPIVTYYLFLALPKEHMFLKPGVTQKAALTCGFDLKYKPELNWTTYSQLIEFAQTLFRALTQQGLPPQDMLDVQSFIWCVDKLDLGVYAIGTRETA